MWFSNLDSQLSIGKYQKAVISLWLIVSVVLTFGLVAIADSRNDSAIQLTDYVSAFYLAGKIVNQDDATQLYPQLSDTSLRGAPFDVLGHKYLPATTPANFFLFMYPPLLALLFKPLACLNVRLSLVIWQLISVLLLLGAAYIFTRSQSLKQSFLMIAGSGYGLFCLMHNLVIGQIVILIGVIPVTVGWLLWRHDRNFLAGLAFSVLVLKPQLLVPVLVLLVAMLLGVWVKKDHILVCSCVRMVAGLISGILLVFLLQTALTGFACLAGWLHCLALVNQVMSGEHRLPWANHLFVSIPGLLSMALTGQKLLPFLQGAIITGATAFWGFTSFRIWQGPFTRVEKMQISLVCLFSLLPLMAIYLRDYDYVIVLPSIWVVFFAMNRQSKFFPCAFQAMLWTIAILNMQMILFILLKGQEFSLVAWFTGSALSLVGLRLCGEVCFVLSKDCYRSADSGEAMSV